MIFDKNDDVRNERILYQAKPNMLFGCKKAIYGRTIVNTQQVVMNRNTIEAMTKVTHNKNVNFGG